MSDKESEEDPKVISAGTLEDLRSYFDQKFSHLKRELSEDQLKSSSSLVKKLKSETNLTFKFSGNKKQFEFNTETLEHITQSLSFVDSLKSLVDLENPENHQVSALILKLDDSLNAASKAIKRRNKLIRIADKSEAGWAAVDEYVSDEVASGSEDEKKIRAAEQRALRKKKNARTAKSFSVQARHLVFHQLSPLLLQEILLIFVLKRRRAPSIKAVMTSASPAARPVIGESIAPTHTSLPHQPTSSSKVCQVKTAALLGSSNSISDQKVVKDTLEDVKAAASRTFGVPLWEKLWLSAFNSRADNTVINYCRSFCSSTIYSVFYAINWVHKLAGFENCNPCDKFLVKSMVEASSRVPRKPVRKAEPITPEILGLIFQQYGESSNLLDIRYLEAARIPLFSQNFIFRYLRYDKNLNCNVLSSKPLTASRAGEILKEKLLAIGLDPSKFSNHSFRSGGATSAANLNVPDRLFKVHGRWKSDSAKDGYVRDKVDSRLYVPLHIGI
ncbi:hypothetical protein ACROYT_G035824 [Oculina patagonica]